MLPDVRCGMARGPIICRLGDVFGTTVNRAVRLTAVAQAGQRARRRARWPASWPASPASSSTGQRRRILRGVGPVTPSLLRRRRRRAPPRRRLHTHRARQPDVRPRSPYAALPTPTPSCADRRARRASARVSTHVAEIVLDRPEAMNAVSTAMARAIAAATPAVASDETVRCVVLTSSHREGVLRRSRPQGAQLLHRCRPHGAAAGGPGGIRRRAGPADARDRGRRRLRARGRLRARAVVRPRRRGEGAVVGLPGGERRRHPRAVAAPSCSCAGSGGRAPPGDLHRRAAGRAPQALELGAVDEVVPAGTARDRALELAATIAANSPVGSAQRQAGHAARRRRRRWRPGWRSRTRAGGRRPSPATGARGSRRSPRSAGPSGPGADRSLERRRCGSATRCARRPCG